MRLLTHAELKANPNTCTPFEFLSENESGAGRAMGIRSTLDAMEDLLRSTKLPDSLVPVALAAPQVGIFKRFFVIAFPGQPARWFFNPKVTVLTHRMESNVEGCLSAPGERFLVERFRSVALTAQDETGKPFTWGACKGLLGRIIQHEMGHLDGVCIKDFAPHVSVHRAGEAAAGV